MSTHNKSYTPPKGRRTAGRDEDDERTSRIPPMLEWILLGVVVVAIVVAAWIFTSGSDSSSPHGAPTGVETTQVSTTE